jgi:hypothetical protein
MSDHRKRPRDPSQLAKLIVDIAAGDVTENESVGKVPNRAKGGSKGGKVRASQMTSEQRSEASRLAAQARWRRKTT